MAFADWPLSNGSVNPKGWLTNLSMFAEHSHRLSATVMGLLTGVLAVWLWRTESRSWLRKLGYFAFGLVVAQGVVGGLRVLLDRIPIASLDTSLGRLIAMLHACLAQAFACTLIAVAVSCSRGWIANPKPVGRRLRRIGVVCCILLFVQLAIGAVVRHSFAGLAIPSFPWSTPRAASCPRTGISGSGSSSPTGPWRASSRSRSRPSRSRSGAIARARPPCGPRLHLVAPSSPFRSSSGPRLSSPPARWR